MTVATADGAPVKNALSAEERAALCAENEAYVWKVAHKWASRNRDMDLDDIASEARVGMVIAAERYDPARGLRFITYATWWMQNCVREYVYRERAEGIHVPRHRGLTVIPITSLSAKCGGIDTLTFADMIPDREPLHVPPEIPADFWPRVRAVLHERDADIVEQHHRHGLIFARIAEPLGISRARCQQIYARALEQLRRRLPELQRLLAA